MDVQLRSQCKSLLDQLKSSQSILTSTIMPLASSTHNPENSSFVIAKNNNNDLLVTNNSCLELKPSYARNKLGSLYRASQILPDEETYNNDEILTDATLDRHMTQESHSDQLASSGIRNGVTLLHQSGNSSLKANDKFAIDSRDKRTLFTNADDVQKTSASSWYPATPNTIRKRQLIDRHTDVPSTLNADELKELNNERLLNFNYCHINVDDEVAKLRTFPHRTEEDDDNKENTENTAGKDIRKRPSSKHSSSHQEVTSSNHGNQKLFKDQLHDDGNSRHLNNWLKETTIKPKTLLNSSSYYNLNPASKKTSKVRFDSSTDHDQAPVLDQHLLGYDWIAALLDNDPNLINQSESFFDDIRDFRKAFKNECSNRFYMETPYTLVDTEPDAVVDALTEPRVRPYVVNDRLFTEVLKPGIIDYDDHADCRSKESGKEPTDKNPRFVRVSIPRSTLQTPYRVKPHRRGSFDGSDSCALMDHCLLGWENSRPVMMPSAKTLDLNTEAGTRIDSETTTLLEAERFAAEHNRLQWPFSKPSARLQTLPTWKKHYMNTTLNMSIPSASDNNISTATSGRSGQGRGDIKRTTDRILSATYSTMYEMERLRQERELEQREKQSK